MNLLQNTLQQIKQVNKEVIEQAQVKVNGLLKPVGSLGTLEEIAVQLCGIYGSTTLNIYNKAVVVCAGDHGIIEEGVTSAPQVVTALMTNFIADGKSGVGVIAKTMGADVIVVDVGVNADISHTKVLDRKIKKGTDNIAKGPAMSREEAIKSIEVGIEVANSLIEKGYNILATGEMGIGNTTPSSAIIAAFTGIDPIKLTGVGANLSQEGMIKKVKVIQAALDVNKPDKNDSIDVLAKVGGLEIGAMAGVMLAGAAKKVPVLVDGFISTASAAIAIHLEPKVLDYLICSHMSAEKGAEAASAALGFKPYLNMGLRLGEGSGAALTFAIVEAAVNMLNEMGTYAQAGIEVV